MLRKAFFGACLALIGVPAMAQSVSSISSQELCVLRAVSLITGEPTYAGPIERVSGELAVRKEACEPAQMYMAAAAERVRNKALQDELIEQKEREYAQQFQQPRPPPERTWADRIRDASNAYLRMQQEQRDRAWANRPVTTDCVPTAVGVSCTTH